MVFVSVTRLRLRADGYLPRFADGAQASVEQALLVPGFLGGWLANEPPLVFWTVTLWTDQDAMKAFRDHGRHRDVMPDLLESCDEAALVHWEQESRELPSWEVVQERLTRIGRFSKVRHPSPDQLARRMPSTQLVGHEGQLLIPVSE